MSGVDPAEQAIVDHEAALLELLACGRALFPVAQQRLDHALMGDLAEVGRALGATAADPSSLAHLLASLLGIAERALLAEPDAAELRLLVARLLHAARLAYVAGQLTPAAGRCPATAAGKVGAADRSRGPALDLRHEPGKPSGTDGEGGQAS